MPDQEHDTQTKQHPKLVDESRLPPGWECVIGPNSPEALVTSFTSDNGWFDVSIYNQGTDGYSITASRGPEHPHQDELDEPLRAQTLVQAYRVDVVAIGFMLTASDMDPFTNRFTRGLTLPDEEE